MKISATWVALSVALALQGAGSTFAAGTATSAPAAVISQRHAIPLTIRNTVIGEGTPKIIVSTTGATDEQVMAQARVIGSNPNADLLEYRIDYLNFATDPAKVAALGRQIVSVIHGKPLILTFRTRAEGGVKTISDRAYADLYLALIKDHFIDILDVEMFRQPALVKEIVSAAHKAGIKVVMSSHDFNKTPDTRVLVERLRQQDAMGADILKIATMPHNPGDVLKLLTATSEIREKYSQKPLLTMAMGGLGSITRLSGQVFGDDLTFGMIGVPSAPGQVDVQAMHQVLETINRAVTGH